MILVDTNLLVYAHVSSFPEHDAARRWLDDALTGPDRVGLPWPSLLAFVRLVTNPRIFTKPEPIADAWEVVHAWLKAPAAWIPHPTERHANELGLLIPYCSRSNLVHDAHLAALAIEHGLNVCSTDGDFARFPGLRWKNPLITS